jgi:hypothetical protein
MDIHKNARPRQEELTLFTPHFLCFPSDTFRKSCRHALTAGSIQGQPHVNSSGAGMKRIVLAGAAVFLGLSVTAQAEVGKASAGPGEWFLGFNLGGGASWGPGKQA